jgi:hypothetical protein
MEPPTPRRVHRAETMRVLCRVRPPPDAAEQAFCVESTDKLTFIAEEDKYS